MAEPQLIAYRAPTVSHPLSQGSGRFGLFRGPGNHPLRAGDGEFVEQLLGLILVDIHGAERRDATRPGPPCNLELMGEEKSREALGQP